jgi:purine-binding chemotaxis protein CheW
MLGLKTLPRSISRTQVRVPRADIANAATRPIRLRKTFTAAPHMSSVQNNDTARLAGKYLTVVLDNEAYGIAVLKVREIIRLQKITPVPQMPAFVKGVINLRGRVIPVIDLRLKFGLKADFAERTCVVVVQIALEESRNVQMGLVVDSVEEVVSLTAAEIEPTPEFGARIDTSYLLGLAKVKGVVKTLLDIERVVAPETVERLSQVG